VRNSREKALISPRHQLLIRGEQLGAIIRMRIFEHKVRLAFLGGKPREFCTPPLTYSTLPSVAALVMMSCACSVRAKSNTAFTASACARLWRAFGHLQAQMIRTDDSGGAVERFSHRSRSGASGRPDSSKCQRFVMESLSLQCARKDIRLEHHRGGSTSPEEQPQKSAV